MCQFGRANPGNVNDQIGIIRMRAATAVVVVGGGRVVQQGLELLS